MNFNKLFSILILVFFAFFNVHSQEYLTHSTWTSLLKKHVDTKGHVDYKGFKADEAKLDTYLAVLSKNPPTSSWKKEDKLAFWINAYNAFTVKLVVKNYPVKSIKDLGGAIYKVNTPWDIKFIEIGGKTHDLNNIEHGIIRKYFNDPRIHFAVNCASVSCPNLRNEAFVGSKLNAQLDDQAKSFINDLTKNKITSDAAQLSKIFSWFKGDFNVGGSNVEKFINTYSTNKLNSKTKISYKEYDWNLNE